MNVMTLEKMNGKEVAPGIVLVGEPVPVPGTDKLRGMANIGGMLMLVELSIKFATTEMSAVESAPS